MAGFLGMLGGAVGGAVMQDYQDMRSQRRQFEHHEQTAQNNMSRERQMAQFYYDLSMRKWRDTNAQAQIKQLQKAGLNPALMYKGATNGDSSTQTPNSQGGAGLNLNSNLMGIGLQSGLQANMQKAQIDLMKAQADKTKSESNKISGVDTKEAEARINSIKQKTSYDKVLTDIQEATKTDQIDYALYKVEHLIGLITELQFKNEITEATKDEQINLIGLNVIRSGLDNNLLRGKINLTDAQIQSTIEGIAQRYEELSQGRMNLKYRGLEGETALQKLTQDWLMYEGNMKQQFMKLNIEQQKVLVNMFSSIISNSGSTTTTYSKSDGSGKYSEGRTTTTRGY